MGTLVQNVLESVLDIIADETTEGVIKVRGISDCLNVEDASRYSELEFT